MAKANSVTEYFQKKLRSGAALVRKSDPWVSRFLEAIANGDSVDKALRQIRRGAGRPSNSDLYYTQAQDMADSGEFASMEAIYRALGQKHRKKPSTVKKTVLRYAQRNEIAMPSLRLRIVGDTNI